MMADPGARVRFNREYFGYLVGYPSGDIVLAAQEAGPLLERNAPLDEIQPFLLPSLEVKEGFHLHTPPLVWLEITRRCNLTCSHCYVSAGEARENEMATDEILRLIDEMSDMGVWAVAITGGEPTLHKDFVQIVQHARRRGLLVGIATNGMFLSAELLAALPRDGVIISISVDDLHIVSKKPDQEFRNVARTIKRVKAAGFHANLMTNTHRRNIGKLEDIVSWAKANGVSIRSVPFSPLGRGKTVARELENTADDVRTAARFWLQECEWEHEFHRQTGLCVGVIFNYGLSLAYMTRRCASGRYLCYICSDGTVYPCTMCAGEEILPAGNVREAGFASLWRSPWEIRRYSWDNFAETCRDCPINSPEYYCASRCPSMSHARHGKLFSCGASEFEILSNVVRTAMLNETELGRSTGLPLRSHSG
jgi:radical SAM protein with 4Fe4S-binding SPASM domain